MESTECPEGCVAAYKAVAEWLADRPSHHYLTELNYEDLKDAACELLIQYGMVLTAVYGSQPNAARNFSYRKLVSEDAIVWIPRSTD